MKHYYTVSMHIILGILTIIILLIIWRGSAWAPREMHDVPPMATSSNTMNIDLMKNERAVPIAAKAVPYFTDVHGFYAHPEAPGAYPGIVMMHEWWGLNDTMRDTAKELAGQGYQVLAVDLFGTVATTPDEARKQTATIDQVQATANMRAAVAYLRTHGAPKVASLGWCFGGGQSLQLALSGEKLDGTIIYYGNVVTDAAKLRAITWPILGIFAGEDKGIPPATVTAFKNALTGLGITNAITIYPGVDHAFANPSGASYAPDETKDAWQKTLKFLKENLQS